MAEEKEEFLGIYREIAATAIQNWNLWNWFPEGLSDEEKKELKEKEPQKLEDLRREEARRIARTESIDKIEKKEGYGIDAKGSITSAITSLVKHLDSSKSAEELVSAIYDERDGEVAEGLQNVKNSININRLIVNVLRDVHDQWCIDHAENFFKPGRNKQFQHLPLELIGWKEAKLDLVFLRPIFQKLGIEIDEKALEEEYKQAQVEFLEENGLESKEDVRLYVQSGLYLAGLVVSPKAKTSKKALIECFHAVTQGEKVIKVIVDKAGTEMTAVDATMAQFEANGIAHPFGHHLADVQRAININEQEKMNSKK